MIADLRRQKERQHLSGGKGFQGASSKGVRSPGLTYNHSIEHVHSWLSRTDTH